MTRIRTYVRHARGAQRSAAHRGRARHRAAAGPRRRRQRQDGHPGLPGRPPDRVWRGADPHLPPHVQPQGGPGDAGPGRPAHQPGGSRTGVGWDLSRRGQPGAAATRAAVGHRSGVHGHGSGRHRRVDGAGPPRSDRRPRRRARPGAALSPLGHPGRHLQPHGQHPAIPIRRSCRGTSPGARTRWRPSAPSSGPTPSGSGSSTCSTTTTCWCAGGRWRWCRGAPTCWPACGTTCWSTSTRTPTSCRPTSWPHCGRTAPA